MRSQLNRSMACLLAVSLAFVQLTPAYAGIVGTQSLIEQTQAEINRDHLTTALERAEVRTLLASHGVTLEQAQERIDALTDAEVRDLAAHFDDKAAGGVIEVILLAALVVVILELVGVTDIFPQF
jgi:hypothetical protein